jgi:hypothetical protein
MNRTARTKVFCLIIARTPDTISLDTELQSVEPGDAPRAEIAGKNLKATAFGGNSGKSAGHPKKAKAKRTSLCHSAPA